MGPKTTFRRKTTIAPGDEFNFDVCGDRFHRVFSRRQNVRASTRQPYGISPGFRTYRPYSYRHGPLLLRHRSSVGGRLRQRLFGFSRVNVRRFCSRYAPRARRTAIITWTRRRWSVRPTTITAVTVGNARRRTWSASRDGRRVTTTTVRPERRRTRERRHRPRRLIAKDCKGISSKIGSPAIPMKRRNRNAIVPDSNLWSVSRDDRFTLSERAEPSPKLTARPVSVAARTAKPCVPIEIHRVRRRYGRKFFSTTHHHVFRSLPLFVYTPSPRVSVETSLSPESFRSEFYKTSNSAAKQWFYDINKKKNQFQYRQILIRTNKHEIIITLVARQ